MPYESLKEIKKNDKIKICGISGYPDFILSVGDRAVIEHMCHRWKFDPPNSRAIVTVTRITGPSNLRSVEVRREDGSLELFSYTGIKRSKNWNFDSSYDYLRKFDAETEAAYEKHVELFNRGQRVAMSIMTRLADTRTLVINHPELIPDFETLLSRIDTATSTKG